MIKKYKDPFGGIHGASKLSAPSPFKIDKEEALKEINRSLDIWNERKNAKKNIFHSFVELIQKKGQTKKALHWEFFDNSKVSVNIHLLWSKDIIRTLKNIPNEQVKDALIGLKNFYTKISSVKPDLSHPDILRCYNQTAKNYGLQKRKVELKNQIDVEILDPFGGIKLENDEFFFNGVCSDKKIILNSIEKDKRNALNELNFSLEYFDQIDEIQTKKQVNILKKKPKNFSFSYQTSSYYFDVHLFWAGKLIKSIKKVTKKKTRVALVSMKEFIESINTQSPDLCDSSVKLMYEASKYKYKPKRTSRLKHKELLSIDEGGMSYWSNKTHRWIKGRFNKNKNIFVAPNKNQ